MKYLVNTMAEYIIDKTRQEGTYRFILPSYPSTVLVSLGEKLEEEFSRFPDRNIGFIYGIAYHLGQQWKDSDNQKEHQDFQTVVAKGWYNDSDNLTELRNTVKTPDTDVLIIVLAGYEHINDQASLADFFHLDLHAVWETCMQKSFQNWINAALKDRIVPEDNKSDIEKISKIFEALLDLGRADILEVSKYLEMKDFSAVMSGNDAYREIVSNLFNFNIPCMIGLAGRGSKKSFSNYVIPAHSFFNYSEFLDAGKRKKALDKIQSFENDPGVQHPDEELLGNYSSLSELLEDLKKFIDIKDEKAGSRLRHADFIYIYENILGYKRKGAKDRVKTKKLYGLPPEVFLRAVWLCLGDYQRHNNIHSTILMEQINSISLKSTSFKHDFEEGEEDDESKTGKELAEDFLNQILGGIDDYLQNQIIGDIESTENGVEVSLNFCLAPNSNKENLAYTKASSTTDPSFSFEVLIHPKDGKVYKREFKWVLPQHHQTRLLVQLIKWTYKEFENYLMGNPLPAYAIPYMAELFRASEEDEVCRLLDIALQTEKCKMVDQLSVVSKENTDSLKGQINDLSVHYQEFVKCIKYEGLFTALEKKYDPLRKVFTNVYKKYLGLEGKSPLGPQLLKAFMIVPLEEISSPNWSWRSFLPAAIVSPLHPALLEMMRHQHSFLCESFCYYLKSMSKSGERVLVERRWNQIVDLSRLQWPIYGTLKDISQELDTNMRSYEYLHIVGDYQGYSSFVNVRTLTKDDEDEEDEIMDSELFKETRTSRLIVNVLKEYCKLYHFAEDGISIGAYCGKEIQPVIAGIDTFLNYFLKNRESDDYTLQLTIFSDNKDDSSIMQWVNAWKNRWQAAELETGKQYYANCKISIAYRVISRKQEKEQFKRLLKEIDLDMLLFSDFIESGASRFETLKEDPCLEGAYRKFPVLEKACCTITGGGKEHHRYRILSNQRFQMGLLHSEVMALLKNMKVDSDKKHAVMSFSNFEPWVDIIDAAHENNAWVVCIDPAVDEYLLHREVSDGRKSRDIIAFGSGVGAHGENNFTVSTEQFALADIKKKIASQVSALLGPMAQNDCELIADHLVREARYISGLSVIQATGPEKYVRELIAHAMVKKILPSQENYFCDEMISLDAFSHWFDDADDSTRPDLLRLQANIKDGFFHVDAHIIECKLAQESDGFLEKARQQIENGLRQLVTRFRPRHESPDGVGEEDRPDQRYWWMQLHRLVASKGEIKHEIFNDALQALERLSEGCYSISWKASAVAFWIDKDTDTILCKPEWSFNLEGSSMEISVAIAGKNYIKKACTDNLKAEIFFGDSGFNYCFSQCKFRQEHSEGEAGTSDFSGEGEDSNDIAIEPEPESENETTNETTNEGKFALNENSDNGGEKRKDTEKPKEEITTPKEKQVPGRILVGSLSSGQRNMCWEFGHQELPNRHILVFGASGTGKTYTIQALLYELEKYGQNSLIVDYTNGFTDDQLEPMFVEKLKPKQHYIRINPLTINPFREQFEFIGKEKIHEGPIHTAQRVTGVFSEVYRLGEQQKAVLYKAIKEGIEQEKDSFSFRSLIERLELAKRAGGPTANPAASVLNKIEPFIDMNPFGREDPDSWEKIYSDEESRCHVIQLAGFVKDAAQLITEFSLFDLYWYYRTRGRKDRPKVIVLDEIQNLSHDLDSPLGKFLTEGRKFGISLILATQTLSNLEKEERDRLFQASHKLFFKPADTEIKSYAQILTSATGEKTDTWIERLSALKRGECYSLGHAYNDVLGKLEVNRWSKIQVTPLEERVENIY